MADNLQLAKALRTSQATLQSTPNLDFTNQFNTTLNPEKEAQFQAWAESQNKLRDLQDYDLRGFFNTQGQVAANGHSSDKFKKPNHPTFSDQSIYNNSANPEGGRYVGGTWDQVNGQDRFTPTAEMLRSTHPLNQMRRYMADVEPNAVLNMDRGLLGIAQPTFDATPAARQNGVEIRNKLFPGEENYFRQNPNVAGMTAQDNRVVMNPYSKLSPAEKQAVQLNESARVHMRTGTLPPPEFALTPEQEKAFSGYSNDLTDRRSTIAARILSGDPSALQPTPEQMDYVQRLRKALSSGLPIQPLETK